MVFKNEDYQNQLSKFCGLDVDWYGIDVKGNIGYFTSAGHGPIPMQISVMADEMARVHDFLLKLPPSHSAHIEIASSFGVGEVPASMRETNIRYRNSILEMGHRGIFCFDADPSGKPAYVCLVKPCRPLNTEDLPEFPKALLRQVLLDCEFSGAKGLA